MPCPQIEIYTPQLDKPTLSQPKRTSGIQLKITWFPAEHSRTQSGWNLAEPWMVSMSWIC
ncbi:hypothetical protein B0H12DRAFT_1087916 [Mycena haematopus]|nr:hypothetical protein B0H12DRAFT_1087916 [Mycena haematopus]